MIGLMVIGGIILYLFIAYKVTFYIANKTKKKRYWIGSILFFILLPTWDVIIGKIYFNYLCENQAGLKVYKSVEVDGYLDESSYLIRNNEVSERDIINAKRFLDYGFEFYEIPIVDGKVINFSKDKNENIIYKILYERKSIYNYSRETSIFDSIFLGIYHNKESFLDLSNENIKVNIIYFRMGWLAKFVNHYIGGVHPEYCPINNTSLIESIIKK